MNEQIPQGLRLVEGYSFETLTEKLRKAKVPFEVSRRPHKDDFYFRASEIAVDKISSILDVLGEPSDKSSSEMTDYAAVYHGSYEIGNGFDFTQLNGNPRFEEGKLVEEVMISFTRC